MSDGFKVSVPRIFWRGVFLAYSISIFCLLATIKAEERELRTGEKDRLDAVLLVDASGSMRQSDPARLRDEGAKLFAEFLKPGDRLAIVQFSSDTKVIRPLSEYKDGDAAQLSASLASISDDGQYTDILVGIKAAEAILKSNGNPEEANQAIILLSDGKMEPDPAVATSEARTKELIENQLPDLRTAGHKIYTLYFSDAADKELLSQISAATDAVNWFAPNPEKIHEAYADLFLAVKKPQVVPLQGKTFTMDPEIEEATFYVNRDEEGGIELVNPEGRKIGPDTTDKSIKWFKGQKFDVITILYPMEGDWQVSGLPSAESFATVLTNLKLVTDWPSVGTSGTPSLLQARLYEGERPLDLKELAGVTQLAFTITPTDKIAEPIMRELLVDDGTHGDKIAGDGIFSYAVGIDAVGEYRLAIRAKSETFQRTQQIPFRIRPRLVSLSVVTEHGEAVKAQEGHGDAEGDASSTEHKNLAATEGEHGTESNPTAAEGEHAAEHGDGAKEATGHAPEGHAAASHGPQYFRVELSPEASALKDIQVKLKATDSSRRQFTLPLKKLPGTPLKFEVPVKALKTEGEYVLEATLNGVGKKEKHITAESLKLPYTRIIRTEEDQKVEALELVEEKPVEPSNLPMIISLLLVLATNGGLGYVFYNALKNTQGQASFVMPVFTSIDGAIAVIEEMKVKAAKTDIDLNDPMFTSNEEVAVRPERESSAEGQTDSAPQAEASGDQEVPTTSDGEASSEASADGAAEGGEE